VIFALFGFWQLRVPSPTVDLRTTARRPVLTTNLASVAVGFSLFAMSLIAPQILELPAATGYGLGQSMLHTGLWMAPGGLAMMLTSPIAARVAAVRGPRFTLIVGATIVAGGYLAGLWLMNSAWQVCMFNVVVSVGVGFAFSSLPALINAAVPVSETAAANGINALARSLGTSISSAVMGAVLAAMTTTMAGHQVPSLAGFRVALLIAAGAAVVAALIALVIPRSTAEAAAEVTEGGAGRPLVTDRSGP
jgi:MFS family permease